MIQGTRLSLQQSQVVAEVVGDLLFVPAAGVSGNHLVVVAQHDPVHVTLGGDGMICPAHRHRVVVAIKAYQGERVGPRGSLAAGIQGRWR